jgi:thioredoxin 1
MAQDANEPAREPTRAEIDQSQGPVVLEFGAEWCGHCAALRPHLTKLLKEFPQVRHMRIEDGKGRPLGRSFKVRLWPTLVFLLDGQEARRAVRPSPLQAQEGLEAIAGRV